MANHIERDLILIELYQTELEEHQLSYVEVDGTISPDGIAEQVA